MHCVYIVRCADATLYTGVARDVAARVAQHNGKGKLGARYTRSRRPVKLVYTEGVADRSAAGRREYAIKRLSRREKLALLVRKPAGQIGGHEPIRRSAKSSRSRRTDD